MNKVTFKQKDIYQNGILVGRFEGNRSEVWTVLFSVTQATALHKYLTANRICQDEYMAAPEGSKPAHGGRTNMEYPVVMGVAVARCKHFKPTQSAKHLIKFLLERNTTDQIITAIGFDKTDRDETPVGWAQKQGYDSAARIR